MKLQKRILALALTLAMVLSLVPAGVAAQETALTLGTKVKVVADSEGTVFTFTPTEDGYYTLASYGEEDTWLNLEATGESYSGWDDDSGSGWNFNFTGCAIACCVCIIFYANAIYYEINIIVLVKICFFS